MSAPAHIVRSVQQFLTKDGVAPMPNSPYLSNLTLSDFVSLDEKNSSQGTFCQRGWNKKMAEALKSIKIDEFKNCFD